MKIRNYFLLFSIFLASYSTAQQKKLNKKYKTIFNSATIHIGQAKYLVAEKELQEIIINNPTYLKGYFALADMYTQMKAYALSIIQYKLAMQIDQNQSSFYFLPIAINFSGLGQFDSAIYYLKMYKNAMPANKINHKKVRQLQKNFEFAIKYHKRNMDKIKDYDFKVYNLGDNINSELAEYFPSLNFNNDKIIFTRRIKGISIDENDKSLSEDERKQLILDKKAMRKIENEDFFESNLVNGKWTEAKPLKGEINDITNEGGSTLSIDGKYLYFTGCNFPNSKGSCDIYVSENKDGKWTTAKSFSRQINSEFWESQPSVTTDGKVMYFASRRPGGFGGSDIYMTYMINKRRWSNPINLGPQFNTPGDEIAPFIHPDNRTLYFASDYLDGYGGYDLFKAYRIGKNRWTTPKNLGYPINSIENESNIIISSNGRTALFSSDKGDSKGKFDIFQFELRRDLRPKVVLMVKKRIITNKNLPVQTARLKIYDIQDQILLSEPEIDTAGYFTMAVAKGREYLININGKSIFYQYDTLDTKKDITIISKDTIIETKKIEKGAKIYTNKIYFETDSFTIKPKSYFELNNLTEMLQLNPKIVIRVTGHADSTGTQEYNQTLSEKRAMSVVYYLRAKKISPKRLLWKGMGHSMPLTSNTFEKDRALNRRIEIEIVESGE